MTEPPLIEMPLIYVASPIDQASKASPQALELLTRMRNTAEAALADRGGVGYWPDRAFRGRKPATQQMVRVNQTALAAAHGLLVLWPPDIPSVGVEAEVDWWMRNRSTRVWQTAGLSDLERTVQLLLDELGRPAADWAAFPVLQVQMLGREGVLPTRVFSDDVGWDLYASSPVFIPSGEARDVPFDIAICPPAGTWARITGRSSTLRNLGLHVVEGVIDPGYRGPLFANCQNTTDGPVRVEIHQRVAQLILMPTLGAVAVENAQLPPSQRGVAGYGSSGV